MSRTTFVLVHGGYHTADCWERLSPHLHGAVRAPDLPGRGSSPADLREVRLSRWIDAVTHEVAEARSTEVVLVGHSLAGLVLPAVARNIPERITRLVFISAVLPREGRTQRTNLPWAGRLAARVQTRDGALRPPPQWLTRRLFCNDMDDQTTTWVAEHLVPEAVRVFDEPVSRRGVPEVPTTYVRLTRDRAVPRRIADRQIAAYGRPVEVADLDSGHDVMVSHPRQLGALLNRYAAGQ